MVTPIVKQWVLGTQTTAPPAYESIVTFSVPQGKHGYIYGFDLDTLDSVGNVFLIMWVSKGVAYSLMRIFPAAGTLSDVEDVAWNANYPADPSSAIVVQLMNAGTSGAIYQASLLVGVEA